MKSIIIQGSSRTIGNTHKIAELIKQYTPTDRIDLVSFNIGPYTYDHRHRNDDFLPVFSNMLSYENLIFLSPVYWYTMSGVMKNFLDRFSDCLQIEKDLGRQLRGKSMTAVSCGSDSVEINGYFDPFMLTAEYLGMEYIGSLHTWITSGEPEPVVVEKIKAFFGREL